MSKNKKKKKIKNLGFKIFAIGMLVLMIASTAIAILAYL